MADCNRRIKLAYIILAHRNPQQLNRLVQRLHTDGSAFFIHLDKRSDMSGFRSALGHSPHVDIRFVKRVNSPWGGNGLVRATLNGMNDVLDARQSFECLVLLSGQDYPIKSNSHISHFLEQNYGKSFLSHFRLPAKGWPSEGMDRITRYHFYFRGWPRVYPPMTQPKTLKERVLNLYSALLE